MRTFSFEWYQFWQSWPSWKLVTDANPETVRQSQRIRQLPERLAAQVPHCGPPIIPHALLQLKQAPVETGA